MPESAIPSQNYLGKCYDIVQLDPLNLEDSAKYDNALESPASETKVVHVGNEAFAIPIWAQHKPLFTTEWDATSGAISSTYDFDQEFNQLVSAEAGVQGAFEFSGSVSFIEIMHVTQSHKETFVYSRAYRETHGLQVDMTDEHVKLAAGFKAAVAALPVGPFSGVSERYSQFVSRFDTHFTTEIVVGGLAYQRTKGSVDRYLTSQKSVNELKAHAAVEIDAFKAGLTVQQAQNQASQVDRQNQLERTQLSFRGGTGSTNGINDAWIQSLDLHAVPVKAKLERLSTLLISKLFEKENDIEQKQALLDCAIRSWIVTHGRPTCDQRPLQYGEPLVLCKYLPATKSIMPLATSPPGRPADNSFQVFMPIQDFNHPGRPWR
jgi:MAC/Perforin domain